MRLWLLAAALAVAIGWEYTPALRGGLLYEDIHMTDVCAERFAWTLQGRQVTLASWCWQLSHQSSPWAFHVVNLVLHLTVTALVGLLVWTLTRTAMPALLAATYFGVNAVAVEAVAYLSSRTELIAAIGVLGACLAALRQRWMWVGPFLLLGWWGKESAVVGVLLIPVCVWYQRGVPWARVLAVVSPLIALGLLWRTSDWWADAPSRWVWMRLQTSALVRVALLAWVPVGQTIDYDYARVPVALQWGAVIAAVSAIAWAWRQRYAYRLAWCGMAWVLCAAGPRLLVPTPRSVFPEHQFYVPLVGMALMLASGVRGAYRDDYRAAL